MQLLHQSAKSYSTSLTKVCLPSIAPLKTFMINTSFTTGIVPHSLKTAIVRPTLKRLVLDPEDFNNYRSTSNIQFISKVLERIVASQFQDHPENNQPHSRTQLRHFFLTPLTKFPGHFWHSWKFSHLGFVLNFEQNLRTLNSSRKSARLECAHVLKGWICEKSLVIAFTSILQTSSDLNNYNNNKYENICIINNYVSHL